MISPASVFLQTSDFCLGESGGFTDGLNWQFHLQHLGGYENPLFVLPFLTPFFLPAKFRKRLQGYPVDVREIIRETRTAAST